MLDPVRSLSEPAAHEPFVTAWTLLITGSHLLVDKSTLIRALQSAVTRYCAIWCYSQEHPNPPSPAVLAPIIVTGLPRTGSTLFYNLLACDPNSRSPKMWEMTTDPLPPSTGDPADPRINDAWHWLLAGDCPPSSLLCYPISASGLL